MNYILKIIGGACIIGATTAYGFLLSRNVRTHLLELKEINKLIFLLKGEIIYNRTPILEAIVLVAERLSEPMKSIMLDFAGQDIADIRLQDIWESSLTKGLKDTELTKEECERFIALGSSLGLNDIQTQQNALDVYSHELNIEIEELAKQLPMKQKLYRYLGLLGGIVITIVIL